MYQEWKAEWKEEGIRQYEIAAAMGVAPSTLSRWLRSYPDHPGWLEEALQKAELRVRDFHEKLQREYEENRNP